MEKDRNDAENVGDVARSQVPLSHRLGFWTNGCVLAGWVLVLTSFLVGGSVGALFPLKMAVPIILFGTLSNALVGMLIAGASARTGYSKLSRAYISCASRETRNSSSRTALS